MEIGLDGDGLELELNDALEGRTLDVRFAWVRPDASGEAEFAEYTLLVDSLWLFRYLHQSPAIELNLNHPLYMSIALSFSRRSLKLETDLKRDEQVASYVLDGEGVEAWDVWGERTFNGREDRGNPLTRYLAYFINIPIHHLREMTDRFLHIPPLRPIPGSGAHPDVFHFLPGESKSIDRSIWGDIASSLEQPDASNFLNQSLCSEDLLDFGYRVVSRPRYVMTQSDVESVASASKEGVTVRWEQYARQLRVLLWDDRAHREVSFEDVGVGVSQVIPVVHAASQWFAYVEQPELHLHPRAQAALGDIFLEAAAREVHESCHPPMVLLETHSELLLLRILRRIREAEAGRARAGLEHVSRDLLSVVYTNRDRHGHSRYSTMRVSRAGEFLDRWPDGFFAERDGELFNDE